MNGDIIEFNESLCQVEIKGYEGAYRHIDGVCYNCAVGTEGFLRDLKTEKRFRAKWSEKTQIVTRGTERQKSCS